MCLDSDLNLDLDIGIQLEVSIHLDSPLSVHFITCFAAQDLDQASTLQYKFQYHDHGMMITGINMMVGDRRFMVTAALSHLPV